MDGAHLPSEILVIVFQYLDSESLILAKLTCKSWLELIDTSVLLWKARIRHHCVSHPGHLPLLHLPIYTQIKQSAPRLQLFLRKLSRLQDNLVNNRYKVRTIDCLEAEFEGKKVVKSSEWERNHNYKGVYDMILDDNRLVASVYDTIQVWDMSTYHISNILNPKLLDQPQAATTCFAVMDDRLVCGTQNGLLKLIDIDSCQLVSTTRRNNNYVSDVCVKGDSVASLDWYGVVTMWKYSTSTHTNSSTKSSSHLVNVTQEGQFEGPRLLASREVERLLDFTSEFLVTTYKCHLTCYRHGEFFRSYPAHSDIFCISIVGDRVAFGCKGDTATASPVAGVMRLAASGPPQVIYINTSDNDPVISLCMTSSLLTLGDVNGELHRIDVEELEFPEQGEVTVSLPAAKESKQHGIRYLGTLRTHAYRDFVWAVKSDPYRIFSGDETGKIVIHDYLMLDD